MHISTMIRAIILKQLSVFSNWLGRGTPNRQRGRPFYSGFLGAPLTSIPPQRQSPLVEITYNWDPEEYDGGRNFGHLAYRVENIYELCQSLMESGVVINRPPRDGRMAFVRSPDGISIELLQEGSALPPAEPWLSMPNTGEW